MRFAPNLWFLLVVVCCGSAVLLAQERVEKAEVQADEAKAVQAAEAKPAQAAPADPLDAEALQYEQYLLPQMWKELEFLRQNCELTREQRPQIKATGLATVKTAAKGFARHMRQGQQQDPSHLIRTDFKKALATILTKEQLASYQGALDRRAAACKRSTLRIVVAELDGFLYLSGEQRDKIMQSLDAKWQDKWESWAGISRYGGNYFPMIPDEVLIPHLNQQQKTLWQGVQKVSPSFWGGERGQHDTEWWDGKDDEPQPDKKSTVKEESK